MISHVFIGVNDFNRALVFYQGVMEILGLDLKFTDFERPWAGWKHPHTARPLFVVGKPFDSQSATLGNGQMIALLAPNRQIVRNAHALALVLDGTCEGTPGLRPEYHPNFYGAYFRDPEGNKLCVCCHDPNSSSVGSIFLADLVSKHCRETKSNVCSWPISASPEGPQTQSCLS